MARNQTRAQDLDLMDLLDGVDLGQVVLPNFQRDFEWTDVDVRALLGTIISGWPVGSLLLIEGADDETRDFYDPRSIEAAPPIVPDPEWVVLDGQQRLTALYQSIYNRGPLVYALKLELLGDGKSDIDALDEALVHIKRDVWDRRHPSPASQWDAGLLPIYAMRSAADFFAWRDEAVQGDPITTEELTSLYRNYLSGIHNYKLPAIVIKRGIEPAAVARIFERVNRTGWKLGTFDLVVARSFTRGFNLRKVWEDARRRYPLVGRFLDKDGLPILNVLALRQRNSVRQSAVLALPGAAVRDGFEQAVEHFDQALQFASRELGIVKPYWLPYQPMLTILAALDYDQPLDERRDLIGRWFWATALGQRYDVASNTRAVADFQKLSQGLDPISRPLILIEEILLESTRRQQGALHRAFLCALAANLFHQAPMFREDLLLDADALSLYQDVETASADPPFESRTLTHVLVVPDEDGGPSEPLFAEHQFLAHVAGNLDPEELITMRLEQLRDFAADALHESVRVVTEAQYEAETGGT